MTRPPDAKELPQIVQESWRRFLETYEPLRPDLYRYCRHLTRTSWDAEDLVQATFARSFATLASMHEAVRNPRSWLFRIASNLWIDQTRRARELLVEAPEAVAPPDAVLSHDVRDAAAALLLHLSPQERAAIVLKDVFDLTLDEIAETLTTTPGAIKAALHRGRTKLHEPAERPVHVDRATVDAFCAAFNARDLKQLTALLLATATVELVGAYTEYSEHEGGLLRHTLFEPLSSGIDRKFLEGYVPDPPRAEARVFRGEPIVLYWYSHVDGEHVRSLVRLTTEAGHIASLREYFVTPELLAEVCEELGVSFRTNGTP